MPIIEPAELLGHIETEDGRKIPHYKVKTETTLTNVDTGTEYNSEQKRKLMLITQEHLQLLKKLEET